LPGGTARALADLALNVHFGRRLENCGVDSERYTGFRVGHGAERIAMTRHGIPDIRVLFESDVRFLAQFAGGVR